MSETINILQNKFLEDKSAKTLINNTLTYYLQFINNSQNNYKFENQLRDQMF